MSELTSIKQIIDADLYRYGNELGRRKPLYLKWQLAFRKAGAYSPNSIRGVWYRMRLHTLSERSGIQIPLGTQIGEGLSLGHTGRIIVNPNAVIGRNVNLATGVTIGKMNRGPRAGYPVIGDRVWIGTNAVIVGRITVGEDVLIAPNAYVNTDVPPHSVVIGNPAEIHHKDNATEGYIQRLVE